MGLCYCAMPPPVLNINFHLLPFVFSVGWGAQQNIQGFGEAPTIKSQMLNLVRSIRTVARCEK